MISREKIKIKIDMLPDGILEKVDEFIAFQMFSQGLYESDTDYLMSVPGMTEKIKKGLQTPLSECVPLSAVWADV